MGNTIPNIPPELAEKLRIIKKTIGASNLTAAVYFLVSVYEKKIVPDASLEFPNFVFSYLDLLAQRDAQVAANVAKVLKGGLDKYAFH